MVIDVTKAAALAAMAGMLACSGASSTNLGGLSGDGGAGDGAGGGTDASLSDGASGGDGGSPSACLSAPPANLEAGVCNGLTLSGPPVTPTCLTGEPPVAQGGVVADGLYVLQSVVEYATSCPASPNLFTGRAVWLVCGADWETVDDFLSPRDEDASPPPVSRWDMVQTLSGSQISGLIACAPTAVSGSSASWSYTATPGHFALIFPSYDGVTEVDSFALK